MTPNRHWFATYQALTAPIPIKVGDGNEIFAVGLGRIFVTQTYTPVLCQSRN